LTNKVLEFIISIGILRRLLMYSITASRAMKILDQAFRELLVQESSRLGFWWVVLYPTQEGETKREGQWGELDDRHDYCAIARNKADQARRILAPNRLIPASLLRSGDTPYYGSWVHDAIVVGVSGLEPWLDELVAHLIAVTIGGVARSGVEAWKQANPEEDFLP
jgi:hypothetical protein